MPRYEITSPDGKRYEVTAPEGASQEQVLAYAQQQFGEQPKPDFSNVQGGSSSMADMGQYSPARRAGMSAVSGIADTINTVGNWAGLIGDDEAEQNLARIDAVRGENPVAAIGGDIATFAVPASKIGQLGRAGRYLGNAALGAAVGATRGVHEGESRTGNAIVGGIAGLVGEGAAGALRAAGSRAVGAIEPLKREMAEVAKRFDIPLHASQLSSSMPVKTLASVAKYLPFSGAGQAAARQQEAFNAALGETFGAKGLTRLSDDAMAQAGRQIGAVYDDIYSRNQINVSPQIASRMLSIARAASNSLEDSQAAVVNKQLRTILENFADGPVAGAKYQDLRGVLAEAAANNGSGAGKAIKALRKALDDAAMASVGEADAAVLKANNARYANYMTVVNALKQAGGAAENVAPGNLWSLIKKGSTGEMRDLARVGKVLLQDPIPDSGTAPRNFMLSLLSSGGAAAPFTGGASLAPIAGALTLGPTLGRVANSNALANFLLREGRGEVQNALARYAAPASVAAVPAVIEEKRPTDKRKRPAGQ